MALLSPEFVNTLSTLLESADKPTPVFIIWGTLQRPQPAPRAPISPPPQQRPGHGHRRAKNDPTATAAAQGGGRSTGFCWPLPHPPAHAASHAPRPPRLSEVRRPTSPAVGGLRPPLCRRGRHCWGRAASPAPGAPSAHRTPRLPASGRLRASRRFALASVAPPPRPCSDAVAASRTRKTAAGRKSSFPRQVSPIPPSGHPFQQGTVMGETF